MNKVCSRCKNEKPWILEYFRKNKHTKTGLDYTCRVCQKEKTKEWYKNKGRMRSLLTTYRYKDKKKGLETDIDFKFLKELTKKDCIYCGSNERIGADRVDNKLGHLKNNIVPACPLCNVLRGNKFSCEEMLILGKGLKEIRLLRIHADFV